MASTIDILTPSASGRLSGQPAAVKGSLWYFIFSDKRNRKLFWIALAAMVLQFIIFKLLYPFPDFFSDSYSYLFAAYAHLDVSIWPIGYSKFLLLFHMLTHSHLALIGFQYFFLEVAALYFFYSFLYFYKPSRASQNILFVFLFFNPLFLYLSNYVNSDPLFAALSLLWFTQLLWIVYRPATYQLLLQAILLFLCFTVRNNAYYYPLIAIVAFLLSRQNWKFKLTGILLPFVFLIPFILHTRNEAYKMTGARQFSLFTGWQLANNALYIYKDLWVDDEELPSPQARELNGLSRTFYSTVVPDFHDYLSEYVGNFFIRQPQSPLKQYLSRHYKLTDEYSVVVAWGKSSAVFNEYGTYLIRNNPVAYIRDYMWLNTKNYFAPPLEKLEIYNLGLDKMDPIAVDWFDLKDDHVKAISKNLQGVLLFVFPPLFFLINLYLLCWIAQFLIRRKYKSATKRFNGLLLVTGSLIFLNFCFCVTATIIVFRYEFFPMILGLALSTLLMEWSDQKAAKKLVYA